MIALSADSPRIKRGEFLLNKNKILVDKAFYS